MKDSKWQVLRFYDNPRSLSFAVAIFKRSFLLSVYFSSPYMPFNASSINFITWQLHSRRESFFIPWFKCRIIQFNEIRNKKKLNSRITSTHCSSSMQNQRSIFSEVSNLNVISSTKLRIFGSTLTEFRLPYNKTFFKDLKFKTNLQKFYWRKDWPHSWSCFSLEIPSGIRNCFMCCLQCYFSC